jgi:bacillithiol biosynthesis deacetylase BshB1
MILNVDFCLLNFILMKLDILAFGSHPDDVELSCAGTLLKHIASGRKAGIIDLTRGELGTRGSAETRDKEAAESARIMGVAVRENLGFADGFFVNDKSHQLEIIERIRKHQPEIVLANALNDRHPDHGKAARLVADGCFLAGLSKIKSVDDHGIVQQPWRPRLILHYIQDRYIKPDILVDISDFMEKKMECIKAFRSQFYDPDSKEPETYISSKQFLDSLMQRPMELGRIIGVRYAEGFNSERLFGVNNLFDII